LIRAPFLLPIAVLLGCGAVDQQEPTVIPFAYFDKGGGRVKDRAEILSPEIETRLALMLATAERSYGPQMGVVTVNSLHGYSIEDFSLKYANAWGLGDKSRSDGIMLLVAPNERQVRIEIGIGIENTFTDQYAQSVIDLLISEFEAGDFDGGVMKASEALIEHMRRNPTVPANDNGLADESDAA
jgi:uncharacterized protein